MTERLQSLTADLRTQERNHKENQTHELSCSLMLYAQLVHSSGSRSESAVSLLLTRLFGLGDT
jgi:hypothetical protein